MRSTRFRFHAFGDINTASSRLRAYYLAQELKQMGHPAAVGGSRAGEIEVFQKVRPFSQLAVAARAGRILVYDFDDNYLLANVGTHDSVVAFMNAADLVTVGSTALLHAASAYHDNVYLFENPLDVLPGSSPRPPRPWDGRLGWFGNPTNLAALQALELPFGVKTISSHGSDIAWDVKTVDSHIQSFDLTLIPVLPTDWTLSKNANRMLKSIALGVPSLVSDVPEHRSVVERSELPEWVLVGLGDDWSERILRAREEHEELQSAVQEAARWAHAEYGLAASARRWLERVAPLIATEDSSGGRPRAISAMSSSPPSPLSSLDVVVWCVNEPARALATLASLRMHESEFASVTLVSALPLGAETDLPAGCSVVAGLPDFFDVYRELRSALARASGRRVLILEAGTEARPGLFRHLASTVDDSRVDLFTVQEATAPFGLLAAYGETLQATLAEPRWPAAMVAPVEDVHRALPSAQAACLLLWELLIRLHAGGAAVRSVTEPLILIDRVVAARHPIQAYSVYLNATRPELVSELPGLEDEWERLSHTLTVAILEDHSELLGRFGPSLVAELMMDRAKLVRQARSLAASGRSTSKAVPVQTTAALPALVPVDGEHRGVARHPVRFAWRGLRPLVPYELRVRLYRRYRSSYERWFPERAAR